jgi:hypothetical protein
VLGRLRGGQQYRAGRGRQRLHRLGRSRTAGTELLPDLDVGNNQIKRDKTGPLETEYFENNTDAASRFVAIDAALAPFFGAAGGAGMMKVVRA